MKLKFKAKQLVTINSDKQQSYSYILAYVKDKNNDQHVVWINGDTLIPAVDSLKDFLTCHIDASDDGELDVIDDIDYEQFLLTIK
jgi:hypothetical protein